MNGRDFLVQFLHFDDFFELHQETLLIEFFKDPTYFLHCQKQISCCFTAFKYLTCWRCPWLSFVCLANDVFKSLKLKQLWNCYILILLIFSYKRQLLERSRQKKKLFKTLEQKFKYFIICIISKFSNYVLSSRRQVQKKTSTCRILVSTRSDQIQWHRYRVASILRHFSTPLHSNTQYRNISFSKNGTESFKSFNSFELPSNFRFWTDQCNSRLNLTFLFAYPSQKPHIEVCRMPADCLRSLWRSRLLSCRLLFIWLILTGEPRYYLYHVLCKLIFVVGFHTIYVKFEWNFGPITFHLRVHVVIPAQLVGVNVQSMIILSI